MSLLLVRRKAGAVGGTVNTGGGSDPGVPPVDPSFPTLTAAWADMLCSLPQPNMHLAYGNSNSDGLPNTYRVGRGKTVAVEAEADATLATVFDELGFRYARETLIIGSALQRRRINALKTAKGVQFKFAVGYGTNIPTIGQVVTEMGQYAGCVDSLTGPNETDNGGPSNWPALVSSAQTDLWNQFGGTYRIGSPPLAQISHYSSFAAGPLAGKCDYADIHPYPGANEPNFDFDGFITASKKMVGTKPIEVSETGYHNATAYTGTHLPVPEDVAGIYYPRLLLEAWLRGGKRWAPYELADEYSNPARTLNQRWFGLYKVGWVPKQAAYAMGRMTRLHADVGGGYTESAPYAPARLPVKITSPAGDVKTALFGKQDGSYVLDVWRTASIWSGAVAGGSSKTVTAQTVTVEFPSAVTVTRYQPSVNATSFTPTPVSTTTAVKHTFSVGADLNVLQIAA